MVRIAFGVRSFEEELGELDARARRRRLSVFPGPQRVQQAVGDRSLINFSSNDYLGLAAHPAVMDALQSAVGTQGAGSGASRLISGTRGAHAELEEVLAQFKGTGAALTFGSGYAAAVGTLTALLRPGDVAILDRLAHASLVDGARASGAMLRTFRHNDLKQLAERLAWAAAGLRPGGRLLVVTESVFSMDGDQAPLAEIASLTQSFGALLMVDEAHSFGIFGRDGRGLADELGVASQIDLHMGTLSKAVGLAGGYVAGSQAAIDVIINRARPFIYSTAPPPAMAAAASFVIRDVFSQALGRELRGRLWRLAARFAESMHDERNPAPPSSAIFPIVLGSENAALFAADRMRDAGFLVLAIRPPTVPRGQSRLRITVTAAHSEDQIDSLAAALRSLNFTLMTGPPGTAKPAA